MADPGFPVGGGQPPMRTIFGRNVCENKRIGSDWGGGVGWGTPAAPPGFANEYHVKQQLYY